MTHHTKKVTIITKGRLPAEDPLIEIKLATPWTHVLNTCTLALTKTLRVSGVS